MNLRELDDRLLPAMATAMRRALRRPEPELLPPPPPRPPREPGGPAPTILRLRQIDDRYARRGPLAMLRDVPQLGYLVLGALLLTAGATVAQRAADTVSPGSDQVVEQPGDGSTIQPTTGDAQVGPVLGESVPEHLVAAKAELERRAARDDDDAAPSWSVVSFQRYLTPVEVATLLSSPRPDYVFFRVPPKAGTQSAAAGPMRVGPQVTQGIGLAFERVARERTAEAAEKDRNVQETANDPAYQAEYAALAAQYRREAAELRKGCACVYAVVVEATARELLVVSRLTGVRSVDLAAAGRPFAQLRFRGLWPEEKVLVTGGNEGDAGGNG